MLREQMEWPEDTVLTREAASHVAQIASRFASSVMLARGQSFINAKSTLGLLSMAQMRGDTPVSLVVDGDDEAEALLAVKDAFASAHCGEKA